MALITHPHGLVAGIPVASATTLAGWIPRASLAATPTPDEAEYRRLTALLASLRAALIKVQAMPPSPQRDQADAALRAEIKKQNAARAQIIARLNAREQAEAASSGGIVGAVENVLTTIKRAGMWIALGAAALIAWKLVR